MVDSGDEAEGPVTYIGGDGDGYVGDEDGYIGDGDGGDLFGQESLEGDRKRAGKKRKGVEGDLEDEEALALRLLGGGS